ncbi:FecCD family ABC transporter permease [Ottowia testudinis]|uniref:Iron ABC transporter permease n=1 Tax=Ottowia testudinis TaxID=2816950 RepID=A0A975CCZ6_9BURK|nr:iron ABC transporter permease [Ottowia testudinis]QTD43587.1 iron ABC transporter permease [Ottowia testudinis]
MDLRIHHDPAVSTPAARMLFLCAACLLLLGMAAVGSLAFGEFDLPLDAVPHVLWDSDDSDAAFVVRELRLPRLLTGLLAGGALGMAGAITQSITRNPLGEPSLMGVTAGAAFAIVACMAFFSLPTATMLACGTVGGIFAALLTFSIGLRMRMQPLNLTLIGMSVNLFFAAAITLLLVSSHVEANGIYYWLTGSLAGRSWQHVHLLWPWVAAGLGLGIAFARVLDLLALDDDLLASLGLRVLRWRLLLGLIAVLLTAATVAATGPLAFVGLVAPHIVRFCLHRPGGEAPHRYLLPLSALTGAALIGGADLLAKRQEIPVGILCVLLGGPLLVHLVRKQGD